MKTPNQPPPELKAPAIRVGPFLLTSNDGRFCWSYDVIPFVFKLHIFRTTNTWMTIIGSGPGKDFDTLDGACIWLEGCLIQLHNNLQALGGFNNYLTAEGPMNMPFFEGSRWKEGLQD